MQLTVLLAVIVCPVLALGQTQPVKSQPAGDCKVIIEGNGNTASVTCTGVNKKLAEQLSQLTAASRRDGKTLEEILDKLVQVQKSLGQPSTTVIMTNGPQSPITTGPNSPITYNPDVNPNASIVTYDCNGNQREVGPRPGVGFSSTLVVGAKSSEFKTMIDLLNSHQYAQALSVCQAQIASGPEWLTPYLVCGISLGALNDTVNARKMLDHFDARTGPSYQAGACAQMADVLHRALGK